MYMSYIICKVSLINSNILTLNTFIITLFSQKLYRIYKQLTKINMSFFLMQIKRTNINIFATSK